METLMISSRSSLRVRWSIILAFTMLFAIASGCAKSAREASREESGLENVVLVVIDTLRGDRLEATRNGIAVMPRLRARAARGWNFTRAISPGSWTKPAMASMFTSLYPEVHNVQFLISNSDHEAPVLTDILAEDIETLGTYMKEHGYATAAVQGNSLLKEVGVERGFDSYVFMPYPEFKAHQITEAALEMLAHLKSPFFLYVHYMDPHAAYTPPQEYREIFGPLPEISEQDKAILKEWPSYYRDRAFHDVGRNSERRFADLSDSARERMRVLYDGEARFIDDQVDRLLDAVESSYANTFTIVTADHGEEQWEHGSLGHGKSVYEEVVHVPLFIAGLGLNASRIERLVQTLDVLPTIAQRLELTMRSQWQGESLFNSAANTEDSRPVFSHNLHSRKSTGMEQWAVYSDQFKLVKHLHSGQQFLFNLAADPGETEDVSSATTARVEE
ncbi:MAG: sulfatase-like hydrolase/transferase, partial [Candidatus Hydrogenedentes bacterium]|nr:sulfatase-like hydrolase/transferase [Candidatus Hydrogenedentota bacterium]